MNRSPNIDDLLKAWDGHHKHGLEKTEERAVHDVMRKVRTTEPAAASTPGQCVLMRPAFAAGAILALLAMFVWQSSTTTDDRKERSARVAKSTSVVIDVHCTVVLHPNTPTDRALVDLDRYANLLTTDS